MTIEEFKKQLKVGQRYDNFAWSGSDFYHNFPVKIISLYTKNGKDGVLFKAIKEGIFGGFPDFHWEVKALYQALELPKKIMNDETYENDVCGNSLHDFTEGGFWQKPICRKCGAIRTSYRILKVGEQGDSTGN